MKFLKDREDIPLPSQDAILDGITDPRKIPYHLLDNMGGSQQKRRYQSLRLSEIDSACIREWILGHSMDLFYYSSARFANVWQMNMGSVLHWYIQNDPSYFGDRLVGWWECRACGFMRRFGTRPQEPCEKCHAHYRVSEYAEYMFRLTTPYRVVGKIDLILRVAPRIYRYGEIKTVSKEMKNPEGSHVAQTASYNYFSRYDDKLPITIDRSTSYIFYFEKKFNFKGPVKAFAIKPTDRIMNPLKAKAGAITEGINSRTMVNPLQKCIAANFDGGRANSCGIAKECKKYYDMGVVKL